MIPFFIFVLGLIFGSFVNAVVYRLHVGESFLTGRSKCPSCRHVLTSRDLVPLVSWLFLRGKCRHCQSGISIQYPLVEFFSAIAFLLAYLRLADEVVLGTSLVLASWWIFIVFLLIIFIYDYKHYLILDSVSLPAAVTAFILNLVLGVEWQMMLLAAIVAAGFFYLQYVISRGRWIGFGDVKLAIVMGCMLSWPGILAALFLAYILGSIVGVGLLIAGKKKMSSQIPFGTFLSLATFITLLYGDELIAWYLNFTHVF